MAIKSRKCPVCESRVYTYLLTQGQQTLEEFEIVGEENDEYLQRVDGQEDLIMCWCKKPICGAIFCIRQREEKDVVE